MKGAEIMKKLLAVLLSGIIAFGSFGLIPFSASAQKVSLSKKSVTLKISKKNGKNVYGKTTLKVKKSKGVKLTKVTYKVANKKIASVTKNGKLTAKKKGNTKVSVKVKYKFKKKNYSKTLTCKLTVRDTRPSKKPTPTEPQTQENGTAVPESSTVPQTEPTATQPVSETFHIQPITEPSSEPTSVPKVTEPEVSTVPSSVQPATKPYSEVSASCKPLNTVKTEDKYSRVDDQDFLKKLSAFSNKLYALSAKEEDKNYVMSPISVYMALSMLYNIGDEGVKDDLHKLVDMDESEFAKTGLLYDSLVRKIEDYTDFTDTGIKKSTVGQVSLTNSIWLNEGLQADQGTLDKLAEELYCYAFETPFAKDNQAANKAIREFIKTNTNGLIDADFDLRPDTLFALINTLYFKDIWGTPLRTETRTFQSSTDGKMDSEFLISNYSTGRVQSTDKADFFHTSTNSGYQIKLILPKKGYTVKEAMNPDDLQKINLCSDFGAVGKEAGVTTEYYTRCIFPKFKVSSDTPMTDIFQKNDLLPHAFNEYASPLVDRLLCVSDIKHKTVIDVNKNGVEGAAVTIISSKATSVMPVNPEVYLDFVLDSDFGFIITDYNNVILFEGQVTNPNK